MMIEFFLLIRYLVPIGMLSWSLTTKPSELTARGKPVLPVLQLLIIVVKKTTASAPVIDETSGDTDLYS